MYQSFEPSDCAGIARGIARYPRISLITNIQITAGYRYKRELSYPLRRPGGVSLISLIELTRGQIPKHA